MSTVTQPLMTADEFLALPDDGVERWLIGGQLREKPLTYRNRRHSRTETRLAYLLEQWLTSQPEPRGAVHSGEAGCRLAKIPDTVVGIDVVYISPELAAQDPTHTTIIDGVPVLAVEILSPSDKIEEIIEKVDQYLVAGVALVWVIEPYYQTVQVFRRGSKPRTLNTDDELTAEPELPGFRIPVTEIFHR